MAIESPLNYGWNFGDPSSGPLNISSSSTPSHYYSATGNYQVKAILYYNCSSDTITQTIAVTAISPSLAVAGNTLLCTQESGTLVASGADKYLLNGTCQSPTFSFAPLTTQVYTVTGTDTTSHCNAAMQVTVTVSPCTGVNQQQPVRQVRCYPNPASGLVRFVVDNGQNATVSIYNMLGEKILTVDEYRSTEAVNITELKTGCYMYRILSGSDTFSGRFFKE